MKLEFLQNPKYQKRIDDNIFLYSLTDLEDSSFLRNEINNVHKILGFTPLLPYLLCLFDRDNLIEFHVSTGLVGLHGIYLKIDEFEKNISISFCCNSFSEPTVIEPRKIYSYCFREEKAKLDIINLSIELNRVSYKHSVDYLYDLFLKRFELHLANQDQVNILFSGGIDSSIMTLATLTLNKSVTLFNTSFDEFASPDILTSLSTFWELKLKFPESNLNLVFNVVTPELIEQTLPKVKKIIQPYASDLDNSISLAIYHVLSLKGFKINSIDQVKAITNCNELSDLKNILQQVGFLYSETSHFTVPGNSNGNNAKTVSVNNELDLCLLCKRLKTKRNCHHRLCGICCRASAANDTSYRCRAHRCGFKFIQKTVNETISYFNINWNSIKHTLEYVSYANVPGIILVGSGADELFGGYARFKTVYLKDGLSGWRNEVDNDFYNLWKRNLFRDFTILADRVKENFSDIFSQSVYYPFLDEYIVNFALSLDNTTLFNGFNCKFIASSDQKLIVEKPVLRELCYSKFNLCIPSLLKKRAIQFGSRSSKQTDFNDNNVVPN